MVRFFSKEPTFRFFFSPINPLVVLLCYVLCGGVVAFGITDLELNRLRSRGGISFGVGPVDVKKFLVLV
jgi:hypothetical protein